MYPYVSGFISSLSFSEGYLFIYFYWVYIYLSIVLIVNIWAASSVWLFYIKLLWKFLYESLFCGFMFLFFLRKFRESRMELVNHGFCLIKGSCQSDCTILCKRFVQRIPVALHLCQCLMLHDYPWTILMGM